MDSTTMEHTFVFPADDPSINLVHLAGSFNHWLNPTMQGIIEEGVGSSPYQMKKEKNNVWWVTVRLPTGEHEFKYVLDKGKRWVTAPSYPQGQTGDYTNSVVKLFKP